VPIEDDFRTISELDLDHATRLGFEIEVGGDAFTGRLQRGLDARQLGIGRNHEFPFVHRVLPSFACKDTPIRHASDPIIPRRHGGPGGTRRLRHQDAAFLAAASAHRNASADSCG
jgi:hypothetical protein